jgi:predicted RNA binding protein YcfA (HicA-like mRNA interferase family)
MSKLPQVNGLRLIRALGKRGWTIDRSRGGHAILVHGERPSITLSVPVHGHAIRPGTLRAILKQAEISVDELRELL